MSHHIVILGAGAIGCHFGALIADGAQKANGTVTLIGRDPMIAPMREHPLVVENETQISPPIGAIHFTSDPKALKEADLIVLAVKSHGLEAAIKQIEKYARPETPVLSLLNGLAPVRTLRAALGSRAVLAGMVPFNVVWTSSTQLHQSGSGRVCVEDHPVTEWLAQTGSELEIKDDLSPIQHGKLLLNLVNPINALSGIPLYDMLSDRGYRRVFAAALSEAIATYDAGGIAWEQVGPSNPRLAMRVLRAPNWLFRSLVLRKQNLDRTSMTSMASDLAAGKPTEIDTINGEITRLGKLHGIATPVNERLVALVRSAESEAKTPKMLSRRLLQEVGL